MKKQVTNDMRFIVSKNDENANYKIEIRLNDAYRNGHEDFAITATFWQVGKPRIDRYIETAGSCHNKIVQVRPDLLPFVRLHLCDSYGAPMHAARNGLYFGVQGEYHHKEPGPAALAKYFRITEEQAKPLCVSETPDHMAYMIQKHGVNAMWEKEARAAIALLEAMTGDKFQSIGTKRHFEPLSAEKYAEISEMDKAGYFTPKEAAKRAKAKEKARIKAAETELFEQYKAEKMKLDKNLLIDLAIGRLFGFRKNNYIYYNHSNEIKFNWLSAGQTFSKEDISAAMEAIKKAGVNPELDRETRAFIGEQK